MKGRCGMQERDTKKHSMATEEHALKIRRPWHCQSELSRLSPENVSKSGEQPKAIIRAREDHVNSTRLAPESSGFSCQILPDNRRHCQRRNQSSSRDLQEGRKANARAHAHTECTLRVRLRGRGASDSASLDARQSRTHLCAVWT